MASLGRLIRLPSRGFRFCKNFHVKPLNIAPTHVANVYKYSQVKLYKCQVRNYSDSFSGAPSHEIASELTASQYEEVAEETLQSLTEYLEELADGSERDMDVSYANGVLTIKLGTHGVYVINKQKPNRQIWLSSPTSGPKRYDYKNGQWSYKHDGVTIHDLLSKEFSDIFQQQLNFTNCAYGEPK